MPAPVTAGRVSLAMYPFEHLRKSYQRLWDAVVDRLGADWPPSLTWSADVASLWRAPDMLVAQTCGWPLVTTLADRVRVVGAFAYDVAGAEGARYRSAIVATRPGYIADFAGATVAVNNPDSLSGWVSLRHAVADHGPTVWTGSHRASLQELHDGRAELASIDVVSLAHVADSEPELVAGLHVVGRGPLVPSLPLIASRAIDVGVVAALREALASAVADPRSADDCRRLHITGFEPFDFDDYAPIGALDPELFLAQRAWASPVSEPPHSDPPSRSSVRP